MIAALWLACSGSGSGPASVSAAPEPFGFAECEVCGMVVSEQPAPRGQVVYRDGTHAHLCSIGELRAQVQQPSPKGRPVGVFVEVLPSTFDPASTDASPLPWRPADEVWFVFGAPRSGVMGEPVLTFGDEETAARYASRFGTHAVRWSSLAETPFQEVPAAARQP